MMGSYEKTENGFDILSCKDTERYRIMLKTFFCNNLRVLLLPAENTMNPCIIFVVRVVPRVTNAIFSSGCVQVVVMQHSISNRSQ